MEDAVYDSLDQVFGVLGADDDIAELARAGDRLVFVDRKRENVGRVVFAAVLAVQLANAVLVNELDRDVPVVDTGRSQSRLGRAAKARIVCLDLDQRCDWRRSWGACCSAYAS
jgi:hypothetical protein